MRIRILGCSGGIGGRQFRTTSILVDNDILIDCGTGAADLSVAELAQIDYVFLTHSHMDHIACLPLMLDTVGKMRNRPLLVYALPETERILRGHIFNWAIWPDFTEIPSIDRPRLCFMPIEVGQPVELQGRRIVPLPASHSVPAVSYQLDSGAASLVFSGDTGPCPDFWQAVNAIANLKTLIVETAYSNRERKIARAAQHMCPALLYEELNQLQLRPEIFITHLKPGQIELTMEEVEAGIGEFRPRMLQNNQEFSI